MQQHADTPNAECESDPIWYTLRQSIKITAPSHKSTSGTESTRDARQVAPKQAFLKQGMRIPGRSLYHGPMHGTPSQAP